MGGGVFRVQFYTKAYEQTCQFYGQVLGLPVVIRRETSYDDRVCVFAAASGQVEVIYAAEGMPCPASNGWTLQMEVPDADTCCEKVRSRGWAILREPENQFWGHRNFKVLDPGGMEWTIYSQLPAEPTEEREGTPYDD